MGVVRVRGGPLIKVKVIGIITISMHNPKIFQNVFSEIIAFFFIFSPTPVLVAKEAISMFLIPMAFQAQEMRQKELPGTPSLVRAHWFKDHLG